MLIMKSDEVKEKDTMKESPRRYTNPFLSDEENEKVNLWNNQELYTDKKLMELECELPELLVCYKEGAFHVKDICVDDGIPHGERILFDEEDNHDILCISNSSPPNEDKLFSPMEVYFMEKSNHDEEIERNLDIVVEDLQNSIQDKDCEDDDDDDDDAKDCGTKSNEEDIESIDPNMSKDDDNHVISECAPEELKSAESDTDNYAPEEQMDLNSVLLDDKDKDKDKDQPLPSLKSLLESINGVHDKEDQHTCQSCEEVSTSVETTKIISNQNIEGNNGKTVISNGLRDVHERGEGESSFSVAGPVSGRITYSGQIAFSGSISLRSDSSTTSTRSFAFPILQTEWNSSPVRMAKADRRRLQKHRGWRNGLLCCRF